MTVTLIKPTTTKPTTSYTCPSWCVEDHQDDSPADVFHRSERIAIVPPPDIYCEPGDRVPQMVAHLVSYEEPDEYGQPCISVDLDDRLISYTELDVPAADNMIRQLEAYTAGLRVMRDRLAKLTR